MLDEKVVTIIGAYPPPLGGISVHISRILEGCIKNGIDCYVVDPYSKPCSFVSDRVVRFKGSKLLRFVRMVKWISESKSDVVHIHASRLDKLLLVGWIIIYGIKKNTTKILTIHSGSFVGRFSGSYFLELILSRFLKKFNFIIVVNDEQLSYLTESLGVDNKKIVVIPAFIKESDLIKPPKMVMKARQSKVLIVGSGYAVPLYAHELLLDAVKRLQSEGYNIGLVLAVYSQYNREYLESLQVKAQEMKLTVILRDLNPGQFNGILDMADLYVRTANADGDCVAIREAIFNNCITIASDCVSRPDGCLLFSTGDSQMLYCVLKDVIANHPIEGAYIKKDYLQDILRLYQFGNS